MHALGGRHAAMLNQSSGVLARTMPCRPIKVRWYLQFLSLTPPLFTVTTAFGHNGKLLEAADPAST